MLNLTVPQEVTLRDAAVFNQAGEFIMTGPREECELHAKDIGGLYCWVDDRTGSPFVRTDFYREPIVIDIINPFSGAAVSRDVTDLTQAQLDAYAQGMDDDVRERVHSRCAGECTPGEFLAAYVAEVGEEAGGRLILGS